MFQMHLKHKHGIEITGRVFISILIFCMYTFNYKFRCDSVKHMKKKLVHNNCRKKWNQTKLRL